MFQLINQQKIKNLQEDFMNRFLYLFLAFTILVLCTSVVFAVGNKDGKNPQSTQLLQREVIGDDANEHIRPPHIDTYVMPKSNGKSALAGDYTIGLLNSGEPNNFVTLSHAVAALQAQGVSAPVTFLFTDVSYTDTGQTIGGYVGQGPVNLVTFKPAPGVVMNLKFSGGTGTASYTGRTGGFNFRTASGILLDGSNSGGDDRSWTIECDTVGVNTQGRAPLGMYRGCNNITVKNMVVKGNRRAASNAWGLISNDNLGMGAFGAQFNITYHNNHFKQGNAIAFVRGAGSGAIAGMPPDSNYTFTNNLFGGEDSPKILDHLATGLNLQENVNNVLIHNNDFYGIKIAGTPIPLAIRGGNSNVVVSNNKFHNIVTLSGAARPICLLIGNVTSAGTGIAPVTQAKIINNMFYDIHNYGSGSGNRALSGILGNPTGLPGTPNGTGSYIEYYHNTFNFDLGLNEGGDPPFTAFFFDANWLGGNNTPDVSIFKNNIVSFKRENGFSRSYLIFSAATPTSLVVEADYNLYNQEDGGAFGQYPTPWPAGPSTVNSTFADWQTITGNDINGKQGNPIFVSPLSGYIRNNPGDASDADLMGTDLTPPITHDIDGQLRADFTPVDVGAHAFISYPWNYDALPVSIEGPALEGIKAGTSAFPKVIVRNNGSNALDIPVTVSINSVPVYTSTKVVTVPQFSNSAVITMDDAFSTTTEGLYTISVTTNYIGDENPANNGPIIRSLLVIPAVDIPSSGYTNNFDAPGKTSGLVQGGWSSAATAAGPNDWVLGTPAKPTINSAFSAPNAWVTGPLNANHALSWQGAVYSPFFSFENLTNPLIRFALAFKTEPDYDAAIFEYSIDNGQTWVLADRNNAINWYNREPDYSGLFFYPYRSWNGVYESGPIWRTALITLPNLAGETSVRFRLHFGSDPGVVDEGVAFDNFEILDGATLAGMKFLDINRDGVKDAGEPGVSGWEIHLAPYNYIALTDNDGKYEFPDNIVPGLYTVYEGERTGWVQTYPTTLPPTYELNITGSGVYDNLDFGNYFTNASISGMKFEDLNGNGIKDAGEPGLAGWTINLAGPSPSSVVTGVGGTYSFNNLLPGNYTVSEVVQAGWVKTLPTAASYAVTLDLGGQTVVDKDFGNFKLAVISGKVFIDFNRNGVFNVGEPGVQGVTVNLDASTTVTNAGGVYSFAAPLGTYTLNIVVPSGRYLIAPVSGNYPVNVTASGQTFGGDFAINYNEDQAMYRSFKHEDIVVLDSKGKLPKAIKNTKPDKVEFELELVVPVHTPAYTTLRLEYGGAPFATTDIKYPGQVFPEQVVKLNGEELELGVDYTLIGAIDGKNKKFEYVIAGLAAGDVINIHGFVKSAKPIKATYWWLPVAPKEKIVKTKLLGTESVWKLNMPRLPMPTYANLINEVYADGGFAADNGLLVGIVGDPKVTGWVLIGKAGDVQKSLIDKSGIHTGGPGFFVTLGGKPFLKGQKSLPPAKHNNKLFAEIVALKLGIAASATSHSLPGFGELVYQGSVVAHHGKKVSTIAKQASDAMTLKTGDAVGFYNAIREINEAFAGDLDTSSFSTKTVLTGTKKLADVPVLRAGDGTIVTINTPNVGNYSQVPEIFELAQNYPNPFNPSTTIQFILPEDAIVTLKVYNVLGQEVATLADRELFTEGLNDVEFEAGNLSSGIYFYQITANGVDENSVKFSQIKKMVLMK